MCHFFDRWLNVPSKVREVDFTFPYIVMKYFHFPGSVKTWETDMDLQCISLGQDLLASLDGEITLSRLWEQDANESNDGWSPNPQAQRKSPQPLWFGQYSFTNFYMSLCPYAVARFFSQKRFEIAIRSGFSCGNFCNVETISTLAHAVKFLQFICKKCYILLNYPIFF